MAVREPAPGLVIRYAYLWRSEARLGRTNASKDRPCVVVVAIRKEGDRIRVVVAPITHSPPGAGDTALEVPALTKQRIGLDEARSWVPIGEVNVFDWPGLDLSPIPGRGGFAYGFLDKGTLARLLDALQRTHRERQMFPVNRDPT